MGRGAAEILLSTCDVEPRPRRRRPSRCSIAALHAIAPGLHRSSLGLPRDAGAASPSQAQAIWSGLLHNNSPPALEQPGLQPDDGVAQPAHGPGQGRRGGLLALPAA